MTEASTTGDDRRSGISLVLSAWHNPAARIFNIDLLTVLIAILLPWSTSGVAIAAVLWIIALIPTLELRPFLRSLRRPICALPVALFALALVGTLWSDAAWSARLYAVSPTTKFLMLPLLVYHFERSHRAVWVFVAFLASCTLLMVTSWAVVFDPALTLKPEAQAKGIFVKNYIDQSQGLSLCAVALAYPVMSLPRANRTALAALLAAIALGFVASMTFVVTSRTALVTLPIMFAVFALLHLRCRIVILLLCGAALLAAIGWNASPSLRATASKFVADYQQTTIRNNPSGMGSRLEFWYKSMEFFVDAPLIGHGTGATRGLFEQAARGETGVQAQVIGNPHNQTLNVAIQWGLAGVAILYAMWLSHLLLFRGDGLVAWTGLLVVVQNFLTSLLNSHLFDFQEGWMYVLGVGVAGGAVMSAKPSYSSLPALPRSSCWQEMRSTAADATSAIAAMPVASKAVGSAAMFLAFAVGGWFCWNYFHVQPLDTPLAREARSLVAALEAYHKARGSYPLLVVGYIPLADLKKELRKGGYLDQKPDDIAANDNAGSDKDARYVSINGKSYGLVFHLDGPDQPSLPTECVVEVGRSYIGWAERPPPCPF